ncbi:sacsin-like [Gigantopelta aegis]|uniref:sacsin-like n=1 Tax=Gigantopelta aegis TaxID=1735272 RepID=UPI001B88D944|nr:sacsin-like [Gigantopelta aegis]
MTDGAEANMASTEDSKLVEGHQAMKQPSLIKQLRSVLDLYPKGQILKEMIQNAEDAGAREIKVLYENRQCNNEADLAKLKYGPHLKALHGPGICVFNDAKFTEKDWKGIQMIQCSNKEQDRLKVGRYGLGFKSVFHVTDWLCVVSGEWILFINPHEQKDEVCLLKKITNLDQKTKEVVLSLFGETFEFSEMCLRNGYYNGTLFWFPLRQRKSTLSEETYTEQDVMDLFKTFTAEAEISLLFLKSLETISLFKRVNSNVEKCFVAQIGTQFLQNIREQREHFKSRLDELRDNLPSESCHSTLHISVECTELESGEPSLSTSHEWLVVNLYKGTSMSDQLRHLCTDSDLSYSPYVGIAYPLTDIDQIKGHVFCFLPLPLTSESTTGLPVHVNGFFALTQDRREVKWAADGGKQDKWNGCLISEVFPEAYIVLVEELKQLCQRRNNHPDIIKLFYGSFPDHTKVVGIWKSLLKPFYHKLVQKKVFFSKVRGGTWLHKQDIILALYDADVKPDIHQTISKTYIDYEQNIVELPDHIVERRKKKGSTRDNNLREMTADTFVELVRTCFSKNFHFTAGRPVVLQKSSTTLGEQWLKDLWSYAKELDVNMLSSFADLPLVPDYGDDKITLHPLTNHFIAEFVPGCDPLPGEISQCMQKLGVVVLPHVPDYIQPLLPIGSIIQFPNPQGVIKILAGDISQEKIEHFNNTADDSLKERFVDYVVTCKEILPNAKQTLKYLKLFKTTSSPERNMAIAELNQIASDETINVTYPSEYLCGQSTTSRDLALRLGAKEVSIHMIISKVLDIMSSSNRKLYNENNIQEFMKFILDNNNLYLKDTKVRQKAMQVKFLPSRSGGKLRRAKALFDPRSSFLQDLFYGEDKFPNENFCQSSTLNVLQQLGLKNDKDVTLQDLCKSASTSEHLLTENHEPQKLREKGRAMLKDLETYSNLDNTLLSRQWMPVLTNRPSTYPDNLPFAGTGQSFIGKPKELYKLNDLPLIGSIRLVTTENLSNKMATLVQSPPEELVLEHLKNVTDMYTADEHQTYMSLVTEIYKYLNKHAVSKKGIIKLATMKAVWAGEDAEFVQAEKVWTNHLLSDIDLSPYRYALPKSLKGFNDIFQSIGASEKQTSTVLMAVLHEIQQEHESHTTRMSVPNDFSLVMKVLDVLKKDESVDKKKILIPVQNREGCLLLKNAEDCIFCESYHNTYEEEDWDIDDVNLANISSDLAKDLGVRVLKNPLMDATEEIDMNFGQKEPLTRRLRNLLHEYTDGFSVPKEIIQNADDAGASEVNFLYDERENLDARTNLLNKGMASIQGPALWAQNNAQFSNDDFDNITKLSGETKKGDSTKIGRFGLGFNAVYNLTDVPSFISGNNIVIFDPHESYLGNPGMKANLTIQKNKSMLRKMKDQFKPFEGVFGCNVVSSTGYSGTLFRFPLRTEEQAEQSQISDLYYSPSEMKQFLSVFVSGAGNLLLFCQNVKTVRMYYLPKDESDASKATLLVEVKKSVEHINTHLSVSVLKFFSDVWENKCTQKPISTSDVVYENIKISLFVFDLAQDVCGIAPTVSEIEWIVAWILGCKESAQMVKRNKMKGLLPIAAAAVPFCEKQGQTFLLPLTNCPEGFYKEGHLFCFLPLPIRISLPLHINAAFALTHDRKQLCSKSEDEKYVSNEAEWNEVLQLDAVTSAVIKILEGLKRIDNVDADQFYKLWPRNEMLNGPHFKRFHELIINENPAILLYSGKWTSFKNVLVLDPQLRFADDVGQIAFNAFEHFYNGAMTVIDVPKEIIESFTVAGFANQFKSHTLSMDAFYEDFFFPNVSDSYWHIENRNILVIFALQHGSAKIKNILKQTLCIPTRPSGTLRQPKDLVHPYGKTACLFNDSDEVFPLVLEQDNDQIGFCSTDVLAELVALGMQNEELQWSVVFQRIQSIRTLTHGKGNEETIGRCKNMLYYLGENQAQKGSLIAVNRFKNCPDTIRLKLKHEWFLPILQKPQDWPMAWAESDNKDMLGYPESMCFEECKLIAGSNKLILDATWLEPSSNRHVLEWFGVQPKGAIPVSDIAEHLLTTSLTQVDTLTTAQYNKLTAICSAIYFHLNNVCSLENKSGKDIILEKLHNRPVILQGKTFVSPEQLAFKLDYVLEPYLYKVDKSAERQYKQFFQTIGVRNSFQPIDAANIMKKIAEECGRNALSEPQLHCFSQSASLLVYLTKKNEPGYVTSEFKPLYLPDKRGVLQPVSELCLDDCKWIDEKNSMKFLHHNMPLEVAVAFGVKTKRQEDVRSHAVLFGVQSFGQHETLTNRLKRILEGYPCDSSLMKELLQNADDAGASELMFIKDFRTHSTDRIFDDRWKPLQGPALCVYNNSYFTQKDLNGIQDLGMGSKAGDPLKTGQYGVGFNAVYHLTDVPTFLTVGPQTEETLCVLDPNCLYTPTAEPGVPGARFNNIPELRNSYKDVFSCFLDSNIQLFPQGTLFRFPLRTAEMASSSSISKQEISTKKIEELLDSFMVDMAESLLFLHNIRKITVASINRNGDIHHEHVVEASVSNEDTQKQHMFFNNLSEKVKKARAENKELMFFNQDQISVNLKIKHSREEVEEEWLVVHQFGFSTNCDLPEEIDSAWKRGDIKLLPRGGVAARLDESQAKCNKKAFCMLPLPIETGLPVHVNGHFALDHEARRNIWHDKSDIRSLWNKHMVKALIIPAYLAAIQHMQTMFPNPPNPESVQQFISKYNTFFPDSKRTTDDFWKLMVFAFYTNILQDCLTLFPVGNTDNDNYVLSWVAVFVHKGFPGFFNNLESHFGNNKHGVEGPGVSGSLGHVGMYSKSNTVSKDLGDASHKRPQAKATKLAGLLKRTGMKVIEAPMWIYENFGAAGLGDHVQCVNPANVITFLQSCSRKEEADRCFVGELPQKVDCSPFKKDKHFKSQIVGLPLCLTNSGHLNIFNSENPILVTTFTELIGGSPDRCLHRDIAQLFVNFTQCPALKQMNINDLSMLLGETINPVIFKCVSPVEWNPKLENHPTEVWVNKLWEFLSIELQKEFTEGHLSVSSFGTLKQWNLLPSTLTKEEKDMANSTYINQLHPIEKAECVINLQNLTNRKLDKALKTLGLPCFNSSPFQFNMAEFASSITAKPQNAFSMLVALSSHTYSNMMVTVDIGSTLLEYFSNNLDDLKSNKLQVIKMLKSLPFFAKLTNTTMSLAESSNSVFIRDNYPHIPGDGLDVWCLNKQMNIFQFRSSLKDLYTFLNIDELSPECFYSKHLLPHFCFLPREAKAVHLKHIKDKLLPAKARTLDQRRLIGALKTLPFIEMADGKLSKANAFFSNKEIVFKKMCPPEAFPPAPYGD